MPSKDENRIRIRPFILQELRGMGFVNTESVAELVNSILFMWTQGLMPLPNQVQVAPKINIKRADLEGDTPESELSEAEAALEDMFNDWEG